MKDKLAWYFGAVMILGLAALSVSCALIEPPVPPPPVATIIPPAIPHSLEGRADCRLCHEKGIGGAPQFPGDHSRRPSDVCVSCHIKAPDRNGDSSSAAIPMPPVATIPTSPVQTTPAVISAKDLFGTKCAACHGANRQGVPGFAPALTAESLAKLSDIEIRNAISDGRPGTAMPPFKASLKPEEIDAQLQFIKSPLP
ncbi:MAG: cytochrome c [Chloroflexota bacterium]